MCLRPGQKEDVIHSVAPVVSEKTTPPNPTSPEAGFHRVNKDPGRSADAAAVAHALQGVNREYNFSRPNRLVYTRRVTTKLPLGSIRVPNLLLTPPCTPLSWLPRILIMEVESHRPKEREGALSALNAGIETSNRAKDVSSITPAKAVFGSVSAILALIRVSLPLIFC